METPKQQAIKAAYGEYFIKENIDENGWTNNPPEGMLKSIPCEAKEMHITFGSPETWCRPRSITDIENNRGWTRIESEEDIPDNNELYNSGLLDNEGVFHHEEKRHAPKTLKWLFQRKFITHYRKVDPVPPPIF
ncbi:hypothetical protein [Elizabethkingia anophelis]|uniref:hypothetical protein n=1 Tax=Elizabethkingia anophelis TaxID=1117645 RepID=UPI001316D67A|nr:hypothetical protein [Elizabethkingia anophelis]BBQ09255.1 hypothetical protein JUNP353_3826 [Elizabethkingia anophelis]